MALSGVLNTNTYNEKGRHYRLSWTATQSVANNSSTITWVLSAEGNSQTWYAERTLKATIAGQDVFSKTDRVERYNGQIATGTLTVAHNSDGTKSFSAALNVALVGSSVNLTGSGSFTLDTIPRASTVTCTSVNIGSAPTITITKAVSSFTHTLKYSFGTSLSGTIVEKTTASTYTGWTVPTTFYAQIPNAKSGICTITCETYNGSTLIGTKTTTFTATAAESLCKPIFNEPSVTDTNQTTKALTGDASNKFIKYHSSAYYVTGATARNSATLKSQKVVCGGVEKTTATGTFTNVESASFSMTAIDSREYPGTTALRKTLINYVHLTSNISANLSTDGVLTVRLSGNYFNGSFGAQSNTLTLQYRYKTGSGSYTGWQTVEAPSFSGNTYNKTISVSGLDYRNQYTVQARAVDKLENKESVEVSVRSVPVFDWGENDFAFNVPVSIQGASVPSIVDQDTDGDWSYRKWSDGTAECWCILTVSTAITAAWGTMYVGNTKMSRLSYPSELFVEKPVETVTVQSSSNAVWVFAESGTNGVNSSSTSAIYNVCRPSQITAASNYYLSFYVKGRWK